MIKESVNNIKHNRIFYVLFLGFIGDVIPFFKLL